jgi:hypothetical protein
MTDTAPAPAVHPLDKRKGERPFMHRALLLWAMMDDRARSYRAVGNAMSRGDSTIREWRKKHDWIERVDSIGGAAQAAAIARYRDGYMHRYGQRELASVEKRMSVPVLASEPTPVEGGSEGQRLAEQHALERDDVRRMVSRHVQLLDAAIGTIVEPLKKGKVKITLRDLPAFIKFRTELADRLTPDVPKDSGFRVVESSRVQLAKESGGDVVEAMYEDAQELVAILGAITTRKEVAESAGEVVEIEPVEETA